MLERALYFSTKKRSSLYKTIGDKNINMDAFCVNDDIYCKCKTCKENHINGGTCSHCFCCIDGEKSMDVCLEYNDNEI